MLDLGLAQNRRHGEFAEIFREQRRHLGHVILCHVSQTFRFRFRAELVRLHGARHGVVSPQARESNLDQLTNVQTSMPIPRARDWFRQHDAGGVHRLPHVSQVDASRDLLDQRRRDSLRPQLFMNAQSSKMSIKLFTTSKVDISNNSSFEFYIPCRLSSLLG